MGLDLRILPQYRRYADLSHDILDLDRDLTLFDIIQNLENKKGREVPRNGIYSFSGRISEDQNLCYGRTLETPYGCIMKGVLVHELKSALSEYKTESWRNKAFIAYLNEMPDDLEIWLYWH